MRRSWQSVFLVLLAVNMLWLAPATAQERKGTITGQVTDADHGILQGAEVELQPSGHTVVSDAQGQFTISDVAPGRYKLTISYVGFTTYSSDVDVAAGQVAKLDATLQIGTHNEV